MRLTEYHAQMVALAVALAAVPAVVLAGVPAAVPAAVLAAALAAVPPAFAVPRGQIGPGPDQHLCHLELPLLRGPVQRGVAGEVRLVDVGAVRHGIADL